jgi:PAS domain S-box-containing protein
MRPSDDPEARRQAEEPLRQSEERFRLLVEGVKDYAIFMLDEQGYVTTWNEGARRMKGYEAEEILGRHFSAFYTEEDIARSHPEEELRIAAAEGTYEEEGLRVRKDGSRFWASVLITALRDEEGNLSGFAKVTRDITERREAEERQRLLTQERTAREQVADILESISDAFYAVDEEWRFTYVNGKAEELWGRPRDELLGKNVWEEFPEAVGSEFYEQVRRAEEEGVTTAFESPSPVRGTWIAGRIYPSRGRLSVYFQDVTERRRTEEGLGFLAEASEVLSSSLDYRATLASVARLAVPTLADWCAVDIVGDDGSLERLAVEHPDLEKVELVYKIEERYPPDPDAPGGVHEAIRTGESQMMSEIPAELIDQAARDEEHGEMLRKLGLRSYMVVPLVARGKILGAMSFVTAESGRIYREADLELAQELVHRAALAVDNAWLYEEAQKEIAERRWAQEELRGSRDQLEIILGGVADGITAQDGSGRLFYANAAAARMCGFSSVREFVEAPLEEVLSKFEILDESGEPFMVERLPGRRALRGEEDAEALLRFRVLETGEERWSVVRAKPVYDEEGRVRMAVNIMRDMTEQRRAQQQQARLASIVESSEDAIISKTLEGMITSWNRGAQRIYGYSPEEVVGRHISILVPPERPDEIPTILEKLKRGEKIEHYETIRVRKDGRRLDMSLTISPLSDSAGNITGASTIARDITERKRTEKALREIREAERRRLARDLHDGALQDLAYTTAAMGLMMLNVRNTSLENELQAVVDAVRRAARGLRDVVNDLRLEQDRPLPELVESLVKMNQVMARGREISLEVAEDFPSTPLGETGTQMLRIIQEALTNTRRHSGASKVLVNLRSEGRDLIVEVSDDGQGFGPTTPSGVGLSSMRERTAVLDGELEVESEIGRGTRVRLRVPSPQEG